MRKHITVEFDVDFWDIFDNPVELLEKGIIGLISREIPRHMPGSVVNTRVEMVDVTMSDNTAYVEALEPETR